MFGIDDMATGALIGGGANLIAGYMQNQSNSELSEEMRRWSGRQAEITRDYNALEASKARMFNRAEALTAREFSERMSNSAVQRRADDLQKAGFNRILAAGGDGASMSSGPQASGPAASAGNAGTPSTPHMERLPIGDMITNAVNSAVRSKQIKKEFEVADEGIAKTMMEEKFIENSAKKVAQQAEQEKILTDVVKAEAIARKKTAAFEAEHSEALGWGKVIMPYAVSGAAGASAISNIIKMLGKGKGGFNFKTQPDLPLDRYVPGAIPKNFDIGD